MQSVIDPVCGMSIDAQTAAGKSSYQEQEYYFCSTECKRKFDTNPQQYVSKTADAASSGQADDARFTKTGPIVSPRFGSAGSGGAEYERLPGDARD